MPRVSSYSPVDVPPGAPLPGGPLEAELAQLQVGDHPVVVTKKPPKNLNALLVTAVRNANLPRVKETFGRDGAPTPLTIEQMAKCAGALKPGSCDNLSQCSSPGRQRGIAYREINAFLSEQLALVKAQLAKAQPAPPTPTRLEEEAVRREEAFRSSFPLPRNTRRN